MATLTRHRLVDTHSPEEARDSIGRIFCPHLLRPREARPASFHARHHSAAQNGYSVNFVAYGAEVEIDPGELRSFFLLQWPIAGAASVRCGAARVEAAAGSRASILSPTLPTRMVWREGCEKIIALVRREAVQRQFEALTERPARPVEFACGLETSTPLGEMLRGHLDLMLGAAESGAPAPYQGLLRDGLTTLLLTGQPHDQSAALSATPACVSPGAVRRAEAYIEASLSEGFAMADVARAAGVSLRSLQETFRKTRGATLSDFIQNRRLDLFRRRLADPASPESVTDLAYSVGLGHLGRAAAAYRARFGETPRETLRRR